MKSPATKRDPDAAGKVADSSPENMPRSSRRRKNRTSIAENLPNCTESQTPPRAADILPETNGGSEVTAQSARISRTIQRRTRSNSNDAEESDSSSPDAQPKKLAKIADGMNHTGRQSDEKDGQSSQSAEFVRNLDSSSEEPKEPVKLPFAISGIVGKLQLVSGESFYVVTRPGQIKERVMVPAETLASSHPAAIRELEENLKKSYSSRLYR